MIDDGELFEYVRTSLDRTANQRHFEALQEREFPGSDEEYEAFWMRHSNPTFAIPKVEDSPVDRGATMSGELRTSPFEGALTDVAQLKPRVKIIVHNNDDGSCQLATVESEPYESDVLPGSYKVDLLLCDGRHTSPFLSDIGVMAYHTGLWRANFYVTLAEPTSEQNQVSQSSHGCVTGQ